MKLTILGCGRYNVTSNYNAVGNLLQTETTNVLLDFGRGNLHALTALGLTLKEIDAVCLSHFHPDHTADLLAAMQQFIVERKKGLTDHELQFIGPPGLAEWMQRLLDMMYEPKTYQPQLCEGEAMDLTIGDMRIQTALLHHLIPDIGFRIVQAGRSFLYSGDTGPCPAIAELGRNVDVMLLECSDAPGAQTEFHLNPESAAQAARGAGAKQLILTHYGAAERAAELTKAVRTYYDECSTNKKQAPMPQCVIAQEGLSIEI